MPVYDSELFDPPAPPARVNLRRPDTGLSWPNVPMLLDSGADITLVPEAVVGQLGDVVIPERRYELASFDGGTSFAPVARLDLIFCRRTFRGQFLLIEQGWGIIGRNVLNAMPVLLDGPQLTWEEHCPDD